MLMSVLKVMLFTYAVNSSSFIASHQALLICPICSALKLQILIEFCAGGAVDAIMLGKSLIH